MDTLKTNLFNIFFVLSCLVVKAQFKGIESYASDTLLQHQVKRQKVRQVVETFSEDGLTTMNARYRFNSEGLLEEILLPYDSTFLKRTYRYDENKTATFSETFLDTLTLNNFKRWTNDAKGRTLAETTGRIVNGSLQEFKSLECEYISDFPGTRSSVCYNYVAGTITKRIVSYDSISGRDTFSVKNELPPLGQSFGKFPKPYLKEVSITRRKDNVRFEFQMRFDADLHPTEAGYIYCFYDVRNKKGQVLEYGQISFEELEKKERRDKYAYNSRYSNELLQKILNFEVEGKKETLTKSTFDTSGRIIEKTDAEFKYQYTYNQKSQLVKFDFVRLPPPARMAAIYNKDSAQLKKGVQTYRYNSKGLVEEMRLDFTASDEKKQMIIKQYVYSYRK